MKAIRIHEFGDASVLKLEDVEPPSPRADEILVRVIASAVNPIEWKIRSGIMAKVIDRELPVTLGWDCAGVVAEAGSDVAGFNPGDGVFSYPEFGAGGTHAEYVTIKATQAAPKPRTISYTDAAALPMTGGAAWQCIAGSDIQPGRRVLIHGAAGGVGTIAVQLAKARGAHVIATASGTGLDLVRALGADEAIDFRQTAFDATQRGLDVVVDLVGGETQARSFGVLRGDGLLVSTVQPPSTEMAKRAGVRSRFVFTPPRGDLLAELGAMVDAMTVRPVIGLELPLDAARRAHEIGEAGGVLGKIVLGVSNSSA